MKKWQNKINRRVNYYDEKWDEHVAECKRMDIPLMCHRAYRREGFRDGAEWMLKEVLHLMWQKKYKCDKLQREVEAEPEKTITAFASALYSRIIKDLKD